MSKWAFLPSCIIPQSVRVFAEREPQKMLDNNLMRPKARENFEVQFRRAERIVITGRVSVSPESSLALGIAFHELATNAVKYGALSSEAGSI